LYFINTEDFEDCVIGLIKILLKDENNVVLSYSISENFIINNSMNCKLSIKILDNEMIEAFDIQQDSIEIEMNIGDLENDLLFIDLNNYSDGL